MSRSNLKVLELCLSRGVGGLEMYPPKVAKNLRSREIPCRMVVMPDSMLAERAAKDGIPYDYLEYRYRYAPVAAARRLARILDEGECNILHMHIGHDLQLAALAKRFAKQSIRLVYTRQMALTRPKFDPYHRFFYRQVDRVITITRRLEEEARRYLPMSPESIMPLYYGVPGVEPATEHECRTFFERHGQDAGFRMALFGRIEPYKGQHLAVDALKQLVDRDVDAHLTLVGSVVDQDYYDAFMREAANSQVAGRVTYAGFVDGAAALMSCFDVIIMASKAETFGLVVAEAMRAGTAVVGSDSGGVPEMIRDGETGLLFAAGDSAALAEALTRLANDSELRGRLGKAGKAFADAQFDEDAHYDKLIRLFEDCVAENGA